MKVRLRINALRLVLLPMLIVTWYAYPAAAQAPSPSNGPVTLQGPVLPLQGTATFTASIDQSPSSVQNVTFWSAPSGQPAGQRSWTQFTNVAQAGSGPAGQTSYTDTLDTTTLADGNYDIRAVAVDNAGNQIGTAILPDQTVTNASTYIGLQEPGSLLSGTITLVSQPVAQGNAPDQVTFQECPVTQNCSAGSGQWSSVASWNASSSAASDTAPFDTTTLADGIYDLRVTGTDATNDPFQGGEVDNVEIDNTPPTVSLQNPGTLTGASAVLTATADDGSGSGVASVSFELAPAGTQYWQTVGSTNVPASGNSNQYNFDLDTRQFANGNYDVRAVATDYAGNTCSSARPCPASSAVSGVTISNPAGTGFGGLTVTDINAPASNIKLLGELPGAAHETWALGQSTAPNQTGAVVVLEYTATRGWQIVQTLRSPTGQPWVPATGDSIRFQGAMAPDGEAWATVEEVSGTGGQVVPWALFHRQPNGTFTLARSDSQTLAPLMVGNFSLRLTEPGGVGHPVYAALFPGRAVGTASQPLWSQAGWANVAVSLEYAVYDAGGSWHTVTPQLPAGYVASAGVTAITLGTGDVTGQDSGWMALEVHAQAISTILVRFGPSGVTYNPNGTGLDALDSTGQFAVDSEQSVGAGSGANVTPTAISAIPGGGGFISARVDEPRGISGNVIAQFDQSGTVVNAWCSNALLSGNTGSAPQASYGCAQSLNSVPAVLPSSVFSTSSAIGLGAGSAGSISVFAGGTWHSVPAQGFQSGGSAVFADPSDGWISGANTLGMVSASAPPSPLASWPEANRNPLLSVALPPGNSTTNTAGALAVGLDGTALHYDPATGWQVDGTPVQTHNLQLDGVAFASRSLAFAVGAGGTILRWNGSQWSADPESTQLTRHTLNAIAFGSNGQGWAVGAQGTILHYDGTAWSTEMIDAADSGANVTSVAVAGAQVFAIAGGNLIERTSAGGWARVPSTALPTPTPASGSLELVSGLPDGGLVVAGKSTLFSRNSSAAGFQYAPVGLNAIPVALSAFRDGAGALGAFISVAPAVEGGTNTGGSPAGDGDLLEWTSSGLTDLSEDMPANTVSNPGPDGVVHPDPVLAVAASSDGAHAWAVGGYAGTLSADGVGTPPGYSLLARQQWFSSSIWRYDAGGSVTAPSTGETTVTVPAKTGVVNFAYMSSALCIQQCSAVQDAQPFVNLTTAAGEIAAYAQQPGGPAFTMLGGNAVGSNPVDIASLPQLLAPLNGVPTYAAYGPLDAANGVTPDPSAPWAEAFGGAPAPFGAGALPAAVTSDGPCPGDSSGSVNRCYAMEVTQNGGTLRAIVLDNSQGSLEASAPGQTAWLENQLAAAQAASEPVIVFAAEPLNSADIGSPSDADSVAALLANAGVLAVFTTSGGETSGDPQFDEVAQIPANDSNGAPQIPEYEGATMTYQQNNGVLWYDVSVNTQSDAVQVNGIPVVSSLALDPRDGLTAARSSTLQFQAVGRRPESTIATSAANPNFPGYDQYVNIPSSCSSSSTSTPAASCITPTYTFTSSDPVVGNFVAPSAAGSSSPKLTAAGLTTPSSTSGLFCAFNAGTTIVTVTTGLMTASLPVTVKPGAYGPPCGTVAGGLNTDVIQIQGATIYQSSGQGPTPIQPKVTKTSTPPIKIKTAPLPKSVGVKQVTPAKGTAPNHSAPAKVQHKVHITTSPPAPYLAPAISAPLAVAFAPVPPAPLTPVPPGGATSPAQSTAKREEKARKHASQSAYVTRPAGESGDDWFYAVAGAMTVVSLILIAGGATPGPKRAPAYAVVRSTDERRRRRD